MNRRSFLAAAGAGLAPLAEDPTTNTDAKGGPDLYEIRNYHFSTDAQRQALDAFLKDAAIPALNRLGVRPVGVFHPVKADKDPAPTVVLLRHPSPETVLNLTARLAADQEFLDKGAAYINATADKPAYKRMTSTLLKAFKGMPALEKPVKGPGRVFQLRIYESPSEKTGQKKIEMFNDAGEIALFRRVGLHPVFFGEAVVGDRLPNLTYMLGFESEQDMAANWKTFVSDPEWKTLSKRPEYADKAILSGITNIVLRPAECSQI